MTSNGIISKPSMHSVNDTIAKFTALLRDKNITLFAIVSHSGEAEKAGLKMRPTKLLIFGNPQAGTPLMQASPLTAIDLPLKVLIWEDDQKRVWLSYNSPEYLQQRHGFPAEMTRNISAVELLAEKAGQ